MNGTSHTLIGAATGFIVANHYGADPRGTIILVGVGGIAGLVPDLDIGGKLRSKLTKPQTIIQHAAQSFGILLILYNVFIQTGADMNNGIGIGAIIFLLASLFRQKHMLMITGLLVSLGGYFFGATWMILSGIYILIASFCSHRTYTHSLLGLCFFGVIGYFFQESLGLKGIFYTSLFAYMSHLVADSTLLPINRSGVPLFLPFWKKRF